MCKDWRDKCFPGNSPSGLSASARSHWPGNADINLHYFGWIFRRSLLNTLGGDADTQGRKPASRAHCTIVKRQPQLKLTHMMLSGFACPMHRSGHDRQSARWLCMIAETTRLNTVRSLSTYCTCGQHSKASTAGSCMQHGGQSTFDDPSRSSIQVETKKH